MSANNQRWKATVTFTAPRPEEVETIRYGLFEAKNKWVAARQVAQWASMYRYQDYGDVGFLAMVDRDKFRANIGRRPQSDVGRLEGTAVVITLTPIWED